MKDKKYILILIIIMLVISIYTFTRKYELENCMSYQQLSAIVERDLVVFNEKGELPGELLNKLAEYKVVLLGEKHYIKEYGEFLPHLTFQLHQKHNFNTLLIEAPQAYSWIYEDYVQGIIPQFNDEQSYKYVMNLFGIDKIRSYNILQAEDQRIKVHTIDINHNKNFFISSLALMKEYVSADILVELEQECLQNTGRDYITVLNSYQEKLIADQHSYQEKLTKQWFTRLTNIINAEIASYVCRTYLSQGQVLRRYREREEILKKTIDNYLKDADAGVIINMGSAHAQKKPELVYDIEWVGQYLTEHNIYAQGNTYCLYITYAKGTNAAGRFNASCSRIKNGLHKNIADISQNRAGFLPFDGDEYNNNIAFFESRSISPFPPKAVWDGVLMLPNSTFDQRYQGKYITPQRTGLPRNIFIIFFLIVLNIESLLTAFKRINIDKSSGFFELMALGIVVFNKSNAALWVSIIIVAILIIYRYFKVSYTYRIVNVTSENFAEIQSIIKKYLVQDHNIELEYRKSSILIKGSTPPKKELKPMFKEINNYLKTNGKTSVQSMLWVAALFLISVFTIYFGIIK